jgi:hypothetical protein
MNFKFVYVDDDIEDRRRIRDAVAEHNRQKSLVALTMVEAEDVDDLRGKLTTDVDLVLADVNFEIGSKQVPRLREIIEAVAAWSRDNKQSSIPIISYTGFAKGTLLVSLKEREHLMDIWDKDSCSQDYVTWRLSKIAMEISRLRPDAYLLRLIQEMPDGAKWHDVVREMPISYNNGKTEKDQIEGVSRDIEKIGHRLSVSEQVNEMWQVMSQWENLSRAVSATVRGHARHVVNVFWMGYYIIHHPGISSWFSNRWSVLLSQRATEIAAGLSKGRANDVQRKRLESLQKTLSDVPPLESLSNAWFFAALFHDVGSCVPKYRDFRKTGDGLVNTFGYNLTPLPHDWIPDSVAREANRLLSEMPPTMKKHFSPLWEKSLRNETPDHGVIAALHIRHKFRAKPQMSNAFEAARAIFAHNLIGEVGKGQTDILAWDDEPLICLLILCDQIQTWDRERGDEGIYGPDFPSRAQLTALNIEGGERPRIEMAIQYIVPSHVEHTYVLYLRMKQKLEQVLREKPARALGRISDSWPFQLQVNCSLGGVEIVEPIVIGGKTS